MALPVEVMEAASRLVQRHGVEGLTMARLAQAAKLSRATLYRSGVTREAVLDALRETGDLAEETDTRAKVLAAARRVFSAQGFDGATLDAIAAEAGVAVASVYRHFGDKDGLVAAFLDAHGPRKAARDAATAPTDDPRADLERLAVGLLTVLRDEAPLLRLMLLEVLRGSPWVPRVRALAPSRTLTSIARLLRAHLDAGRLRGDDPLALAHAFSGTLMAFGLFGPLLDGRPPPDPAATARFVTDLFLQGALAPKEPR